MQTEVSYNGNGNVDYLKFINNMQFKEMKFSYKLKKSMVKETDYEDFHKNMD